MNEKTIKLLKPFLIFMLMIVIVLTAYFAVKNIFGNKYSTPNYIEK